MRQSIKQLANVVTASTAIKTVGDYTLAEITDPKEVALIFKTLPFFKKWHTTGNSIRAVFKTHPHNTLLLAYEYEDDLNQFDEIKTFMIPKSVAAKLIPKRIIGEFLHMNTVIDSNRVTWYATHQCIEDAKKFFAPLRKVISKGKESIDSITEDAREQIEAIYSKNLVHKNNGSFLLVPDSCYWVFIDKNNKVTDASGTWALVE